MTYTKPEIKMVGDATHVIQYVGKGVPTTMDLDLSAVDPAYDLDE